MHKRVITECIQVEHIPLHLTYDDTPGEKILVLFIHSILGNKEEGARIALKLAKQGAIVVNFDLYNHGERQSVIYSNDSIEAYKYQFGISEKTNSDVYTIVNYLKTRDDLSFYKIGAIGVSGGANIVYYLLAHNPIINFGCSVLGSPDYTGLLMYLLEKTSEQDFITPLELDVYNFIHQMNPFKELSEKLHKPLLIIGALNDDVIPMFFANKLYRTIKPRYKEMNIPIEFYYEDQTHNYTTSMENRIVKFIEAFILEYHNI